MTQSKQPVHSIRFGRIRAAIWNNEGENGARYSVTVTKSYTRDNGKTWADTSSFSRDDLLLTAKSLNEAHSWIFEQR